MQSFLVRAIGSWEWILAAPFMEAILLSLITGITTVLSTCGALFNIELLRHCAKHTSTLQVRKPMCRDLSQMFQKWSLPLHFSVLGARLKEGFGLA